MENTISPTTHTVVTDDAGQVFLFNGRIMLQNISSGDIIYAPLTEAIQSAFNIKAAEERQDEQCDLEQEEVVSIVTEGTSKVWTKNTTVFLIQQIKEMGEKFENEMKKTVYSKLAIKLQNEFHQTFSAAQIETKWKALKRTYKSTILHNNTSGKERRKWEYFQLMHDLLFHKPEITPPATCSSISGLKLLKPDCEPSTSTSTVTTQETAQLEATPEEQESKHESSFSRKRKQRVSDATKRHTEKMARLDRFNDLFQQMLEKM